LRFPAGRGPRFPIIAAILEKGNDLLDAAPRFGRNDAAEGARSTDGVRS
jgi:hypothetical protein